MIRTTSITEGHFSPSCCVMGQRAERESIHLWINLKQTMDSKRLVMCINRLMMQPGP